MRPSATDLQSSISSCQTSLEPASTTVFIQPPPPVKPITTSSGHVDVARNVMAYALPLVMRSMSGRISSLDQSCQFFLIFPDTVLARGTPAETWRV